jgi:hypothetical protein
MVVIAEQIVHLDFLFLLLALFAFASFLSLLLFAVTAFAAFLSFFFAATLGRGCGRPGLASCLSKGADEAEPSESVWMGFGFD